MHRGLEMEIKLFSEIQADDLLPYQNEKKEFCKSSFWSAHKSKLPVHYAVYLADCASKKAASANVETIFSGAKRLSDNATTMGDELLGAYVVNHANWTYEWMKPEVHDIVCAYLKEYGQVDSEDLPTPVEEVEGVASAASAATPAAATNEAAASPSTA